jgi:antitoxin VapB
MEAIKEKREKRAKLFINGNSQAVRLPKEFRFVGKEVRVRREGENVVLEPIGPQIAEKDLEAVRRVLDTLAPLKPELAAMVEEAIGKLEEG